MSDKTEKTEHVSEFDKELTTVGARMKWARKQLNLTGEELAKRTGVRQSAISKLEVGGSAYPAAEFVFPLADALQVSARWLLTGVEAQNENDAPMSLLLSEDLQRLVAHIQTLEEAKVDGLFALLGVRRS